MKRLILLTILICTIGTTKAQWHYTITSQSYNGNCDNIGAVIQESVIEQEVPKWAAKVYSSQEECESARQQWGMVNYSSGGCYARVTSTPCQGNTGGGNGTGSGTSMDGGTFQGKTSMYSSTAIGEPYFAPNEAYAVSSIGQDLEIKLQALNKSFNDAVGGRGIKTGDQSFDDNYRRQVNSVPKSNNEGIYVFNSRPQYVKQTPIYLEEENSFASEGDIIVPIDPERIKNQENDERWEKSQKETQHRIDSIMEKNQHKIDSILRSRGEKPNKNINEDENEMFKGLGETFYDVTSATYDIMTDAVMFTSDGIRLYELLFDVKVPCRDRLAELEDIMVNSKEVFTASLVGNITEASSIVADQAVIKFLEPTSEVVGGMVTTASNTYTTIFNSLSAGNLVRRIDTDAAKTVLNGIRDMANGGDSNKWFGEIQKRTFNYERDIAKWFFKRNLNREPIKVKE